MSELERGGQTLGKIHRKANDKKYFCYFTGFLEGVVSSGAIENGEISPLVDQCKEFVLNIADSDAADFIADFEIDLLEHDAIADAVHYRLADIDQTCSKSALNRFMGFCAGIACDDMIRLEEAKGIILFAREHDDIMSDPIVRAIVYCCDDALLDGTIDAIESANICSAITQLVGDSYADTGLSSLGNTPVFPEGTLPNELTSLEGEIAVFTGNFDVRPRKILEDELAALGATISKTITSKTSYLIVGSEAARDWVSTHKGNKMIKALDLQGKTGRPEFISESQLKKALLSVKS
jgi:hypothetical protein